MFVIFGSLLVCIVLGVFLSSTYNTFTGATTRDSVASLPPIPSMPGGSPASCSDTIKNQDESDRDCGGVCSPLGKKCALDKTCSTMEDCESGYCYIQRCKIKPIPSVEPLLKKEPIITEEPKKTVIVLGPPATIPRTPNTYSISIELQNGKFAFVPNKVKAIVSDILIITNKDSAQHQPVTPDRSIEGDKLSSGQSWSYTLITPGEIVFHDDLHPSTTGIWSDFKISIAVHPWSGTCDDKQKNLDETDTDCGGLCPQCQVGKSCKINNDCTTSLCRDNVCSHPLPISCTDNLKNQDETDDDCGGSCQKCADGKSCASSSDCKGNYCSKSGLCLTPSCTDNEKNQDESAVDCGGKCRKCLQGSTCSKNEDCVTAVCSNGICDIPTTEIQMVAKQFEFVPNQITVTKGNRVRINITSIDVPHGFSLPAFIPIKKLLPQIPQQIEFIADKVGEFEFLCDVYCGSGHKGMRGKLIIKEKTAEKEAGAEFPVAKEKQIFEEKPTLPQQKQQWWMLLVITLLIVGIGFSLYQKQEIKSSHLQKIDFVQEYITTMRKKGYSDDHIYHQLIQHGYTKQEVENHICLPGEKLEQYVKRLRRLGYAREKIMKELLVAGHKPGSIHDALEHVKW